MTWTPNTFGLGPERITNEWLNRLQEQVASNRDVLKTFHAGVVWGCQVTFLDADDTVTPPASRRVQVARGAVISDGTYFDISATEIEVTGDPGDYVWVYVDAGGDVTVAVQSEPQWPDQTVPPVVDDVDVHLAVLGLGRLDLTSPIGESWEWGHDVRYFVREKPNGAVLVVGDLDAGADFETLQQALDYLGACEEGDNDVPRRILVTRSLDISEPLQVRCNGVVIEGVLNEVGAPSTGAADERILLTWSYTDSTMPANAAIININDHKDVWLRNLHFIHSDTDAWCAVYDPGDGFCMEGCVFGQEDQDSRLAVAVDFGELVTEGVRAWENRAYNLHRGLFGFTRTDQQSGDTTEGFTTGCLRRSWVYRNYVSTMGLTVPDGDPLGDPECRDICGETLPDGEIWAWDDPRLYFYAIDTGVNPDKTRGCLYNTIQENVIEACFNGIRVGKFSKVRSNSVRQCILFGVMATATGVVEREPLSVGQDQMGGTEISGNFFEFGYIEGVPWWRAGIRLEMTTCFVAFNSVVLGSAAGCGILHGPLVLSEYDSLEAHFAALRLGAHAVVGNNVISTRIDSDGTVAHDDFVTLRGMGIGLLSTQNRVTDNGVFHARTGILVTGGNVVSNNVIEPAVTAVFAWSHNVVTGNTVGWFPHTSNGLPWSPVGAVQKSGGTGGTMFLPSGAIELSNGNVCEGNVVVCGMDSTSYTSRPAAVYVADWPTLLFGSAWGSYFDDMWGSQAAGKNPLAAQLKGKRVGGNVIANHVIQLANATVSATGAAEAFEVDGVRLEAGWRENSVSGVFIWNGQQGVYSSGTCRITGCSVWDCRQEALRVEDGQNSEISGCVFSTSNSRTVYVGGTSDYATVNDCVMYQSGSATVAGESGPAPSVASFSPECLRVEADGVAVNDCALINRGNACIEWHGNFGVCGGCWFKACLSGADPVSADIYKFFPAIRFTKVPSGDETDPANHYYPDAGTQGNLVYGAHMLHCSPLGMDSQHETRSPIEWSNKRAMYDYCASPDPFDIWNPHPPQYNYSQDRWTNRVCVESCYFWEIGVVVA